MDSKSQWENQKVGGEEHVRVAMPYSPNPFERREKMSPKNVFGEAEMSFRTLKMSTGPASIAILARPTGLTSRKCMKFGFLDESWK